MGELAGLREALMEGELAGLSDAFMEAEDELNAVSARAPGEVGVEVGIAAS